MTHLEATLTKTLRQFEFLRQLSLNPANTVIGLVRSVEETEAKVKTEINRSNVHIIHGDLDSYQVLEEARNATSRITGGSLDYLIANGARLPKDSGFVGFGELAKNPTALEEEILTDCKTNVIGNIHLFSLFLPLLLKGEKKKVVFISSGLADLDLISKYEIEVTGPYSLAKAATNVAVAKFHAEYAKDGVLFMSISPGVVDTGYFDPSKLTEKEQQGLMAMTAKFQQYAPHFKGPITPEESVKQVIAVYEKASLANGDGGSFVSHLGTKQWL
ncbi:short-chain dehydrogenase [Diaporthe sp. PMI_573]|nr:short-chain dehydrogenase [Diaporthaceae sp. PMI_573]